MDLNDDSRNATSNGEPFYPEIQTSQVDNGKFRGEGKHEAPEKFLYDLLLEFPSKFLNDTKQVVKTYSRLVQHPYPDLCFEDHKEMITEYALELAFARKAPNKVYEITNMDVKALAAMAKYVALGVAQDTTFYLQVVHLTLLRVIYGSMGPPNGARDRFITKWINLPSSLEKQMVHLLHSEEDGVILPDDIFEMDDGFSLMTVNNDVESDDDTESESSGVTERGNFFGSTDLDAGTIDTFEHSENPSIGNIGMRDHFDHGIDKLVRYVTDTSRAIWHQDRINYLLGSTSDEKNIKEVLLGIDGVSLPNIQFYEDDLQHDTVPEMVEISVLVESTTSGNKRSESAMSNTDDVDSKKSKNQ